MTITKSKLNKWHNAFEILTVYSQAHSFQSGPLLSALTAAKWQTCWRSWSSRVTFFCERLSPGSFTSSSLTRWLWGLHTTRSGKPTRQCRKSMARRRRTPLRMGAQTGHTILSLWREENDPSWQGRPACLPEPATQLPPRPSGSLQGWAFLQTSGIQSMKIDR